VSLSEARSTARTETHVAFRESVANPEWEGLAVTIGGSDGNGGGGGGGAGGEILLWTFQP
jgi:hypothetical protein